MKRFICVDCMNKVVFEKMPSENEYYECECGEIMVLDYDNLLERQRKYMGLSLGQASKLLGISKTQLFDIEKGKSTNPKADVLNAFHTVYGLSKECLMDLFNFSIEHETSEFCWCEPEFINGIYVHRAIH